MSNDQKSVYFQMQNKSSGMKIVDRFYFLLIFRQERDGYATCDLHTPIRSKRMDDFIRTHTHTHVDVCLCAFIWKMCPQRISHAGLGPFVKLFEFTAFTLSPGRSFSLSLTHTNTIAPAAYLPLLHIKDKRFIFYFHTTP